VIFREPGDEGQRIEVTKIYTMQVKVLFFGVLSEVAGTDCRHYNEVGSVNDLKIRILDEYPEIENYNYRISLNNTITTGNGLLKDGDEVALLPPFAGG
jgi:molybdopterin synthase sulfur carrier subunit